MRLRLEPRGACDTTSKSVTKTARSQCMLRVFMFMPFVLVVDVVCLMLVLSARVVVLAVDIQFS